MWALLMWGTPNRNTTRFATNQSYNSAVSIKKCLSHLRIVKNSQQLMLKRSWPSCQGILNFQIMDSLYNVRIIENVAGQECSICQVDNSTVYVATVCNHIFCWMCLRRWLFERTRLYPTCPMCREPLENNNLGIPRPNPVLEVPAERAGDNVNVENGLQPDNNMVIVQNDRQRSIDACARELFYVRVLESNCAMIGNHLERKYFPLILQEYELPVLSSLGFRKISKFFGNYPVELSWYKSTRKVLLLPGIVEELQMFWSHTPFTLENYKVSVMRCSNLLRGINGTAKFLLANQKYAPLIALLDNFDLGDVALMVHSRVIDKWFVLKYAVVGVGVVVAVRQLHKMSLVPVKLHGVLKWLMHSYGASTESFSRLPNVEVLTDLLK
jgi:hypothetical protein